MPILRSAFVFCLLGLIASSRAAAADSAISVALRISPEAVDLDGALDEPVWQRAPVLTGLRQREPDVGANASEVTELRILYDDASLYFGIRALDSEPDKVVARILQRDRVMSARDGGRVRFGSDDAVAILLDSFHDRRNAMVFATNANGAQFDALISDEGESMNVDWRAIWDVRARRDSDGWTAEIVIPFRTLRYPPGSGEVWGLNLSRMIRRKNEEVLWASWSRDGGGFHRVSRAGELHGLEDLPRQGLNLEVKPYGLAGYTEERDEDSDLLDSQPDLDAGFDLKWEVHPGLVLDGTVNPDFAQVEADDQQINLTRFDLFFPEKREFFLENAGVFDFGSRGFFEPPPLLLFFSRNIGISDDGEIPVRAGVRLTGRAGRQTIGFLDTVTGAAFEEPSTNFAVARVKRDIGRSNYLGAIVTDRRSAGSWNTTAGVDASVWPSEALNVQAFYARTWTQGDGGNDDAYRLAADLTGDRFGFNAEALKIGPETEAEMGFITRTDIRSYRLFNRATLRPRFLGLRKIDVFLAAGYLTNVAGQRQDWSYGPWVTLEWNSGDNVGGFWGEGANVVDESFELGDRVEVPVGDYELENWGIFGSTSSRRPISIGAFWGRTRNFGGTLVNLGVGLGVATGPHLKTSLGYSRNEVDLPDGGFVAHRPSLRLSWSFTTRLVASAFLQYNSLDDEFVGNLRLHFIYRPGSDIFLVFNEGRGREGDPWLLRDRGLVFKITYLKRI